MVLSGNGINNLRFAVDIASFTDNEYHLQTVVDGIDRESSRLSMRINTDQAELKLILKSMMKDEMKIIVKGKNLKQVKEFIYLGGKFVENGII